MTCKDCIHYEVCYHIEHYGRHMETEEPCGGFKNKSDYAEVKHGEWIWTETGDEDYEQYWVCSVCGEKDYIESKYCSECGADMRGEKDAVQG